MKIRAINCFIANYVFFLIVLPLTVFSNPISKSEMLRYGVNAFRQRAESTAPNAVDYELKNFTPVTVDGELVMGILNFENGFLIMAADDASQPVLAYAFEGGFYLEDAAPGVRMMLHQYEQEVLQLKKEHIAATSEIRQQWAALESCASKAVTSVIVQPLITAKWNQTRYYNRYSPLDVEAGSSYDFRTPNGCVAVAMAMIMYYYRYPLHGYGSHTNHTYYGDFSVDFSQQTYDYEKMYDELIGYADEVAKLIFHCATAVDMAYAADGSGAYSENVPDAVKNYFGYSSECELHHKWGMQNSQWRNLIKTELNASRPVYFSGASDEGGHAFVCDGYDSDNLFHFNFGWGGSGNGYYALSNDNNAVNGFSGSQQVVTHFYPGSSDYPFFCNSKVVNSMCGTLEDGSSIEDYQNDSHCEWVITEDSVNSIYVNFDYFNTQEDHDFLRFWDGNPSQGNLLLTLSGGMPATSNYTFETDSLYVTFDTDAEGTDAGWRFYYQVNRRLYSCFSGIYHECSGSISDGSGDATYKPNASCFWNLRIPSASWIKLTFQDFDLSPEDELRIYDQSEMQSNLLYSLTGSSIPDPITINGGSVRITFLSDNSKQKGGFSLQWTTDCADGVDDYEDSGDIRVSPNPASTMMNVEIPAAVGFGTVELYDMTGRLVLTHHVSDSKVCLPVSDLVSGLYMVKVISQNRIYNSKVVIRH